jgi:hypothetical protein
MEKDTTWLESQVGPDAHGRVVDRQFTYPRNTPNCSMDLSMQLVETGATPQALLSRQQASLHVCEYGWREMALMVIPFPIRTASESGALDCQS